MYKLVKTNVTEMLIKNEILIVPQDPSNSDYIEYQNWCSEGNEAEVVDTTGGENV